MKKKVLMFFMTLVVIFSFGFNILSFAEEDNKEEKNQKKVVYLTFDDGPSKVTLKTLKVLDDENVKATFFVVGKMAESYPEILKEVLDAGHNICIHTYSHENSIYKSKEEYFKDYDKATQVLKELLNEDVSKFMRMPGGSSTTIPEKNTLKAIRDELDNRELYYVDWNVTIEDALGCNVPPAELIKNYTKGINRQGLNTSNVIILMHDGGGNKTTPEALKYIIRDLKEKGYEFKTFSDVTDNELNKLMEGRIINRYNRGVSCDNPK